MRIGIYDQYFDDIGGGEKYIMTIAECLSQKHDVNVFWDSERDFQEVQKRFVLDLHKVKRVKNIFSPKVSFLEKFVETLNYDTIIMLCDGSIPLVFSRKLFLHIQQPLPHIAVNSWIGKFKLSHVTGFFYNSKFTESFNAKALKGVPSTIIYPPVAIHDKEVKKENIILHVGRFRVQDAVTGIKDYKKQSVMIEAFKKMVDKKMVKDWRFVMAVSVHEKDQEKFNEMEATAKGYPIEFFVNKTNDELWIYYNKAKIYWHASGFGEDLDAHPEYAEHFGISTVEAMGAGAVPVVINAGGQKEIVTEGENGLLWDSLEELQEKTKKVMKDEKLREQLSEKAQLRAKDFSKEHFASQITKLVEQG